MRTIVVVFALLVCCPISAAWLRGNLHTHTMESDGDSTPVEVARWYREHGYDFLIITDHDKVTKIEAPPGLLLIPGEEITDRLAKRSLHVNAIGIDTAIAPQRGSTVVEVLQRNVDAVRKAGGIALINHPNFGWAFGADELQQIEGVALLEIASGHPYVNTLGPPPVEAMWDALLTAGKRIFGVAVDDMHHLKRPWDTDVALPGKAWVVVRAEKNDAKSVLGALQRGEFYASTGVELEDYASSTTEFSVKVREKNTAHYRILFIGARGRVLQETEGATARYAIRGDEGYVRAKVIDSNGRMAWLQPVTIARSRSR